MNKIILAPDSFKGTLSSREVCELLRAAALSHFPACQMVSIPVADGGEGSVDCFLTAMGGEKVSVTVAGPYSEPMEAYYGLVNEGKTAVVEMAACAGLPLVSENPNPELTTTFGVGQLMEDALERGCEEIVVALGGSCTNDAGCGAAAALGARFFDREDQIFVPTGINLNQIEKIDLSAMNPRLKDVRITVMCDIQNPMFGPRGAAFVFGPQKGADAAMVDRLDYGLRHLALMICRDLGADVSDLPGGGAAGAMGAGMVAFFGGILRSGIQTVLDFTNFDRHLQDADLVITGEGRLDSQSLGGKVISGVASRAKAQNVPVIALVGLAQDDIDGIYPMGVTAVVSVSRIPAPMDQIIPRAGRDFAATADNLMRLLTISGK